jgi:hypothetical protein
MFNNHPFFHRFKEIISDPVNKKISRKLFSYDKSEGLVKMHNGVIVNHRSYYSKFGDIFILNKGVHEPQEEYIFDIIIKGIKEKDPIMLELGSYWGFYSLSLLQEKPESKCYLIEPGVEEMNQGKNNFKLNNRNGNFINGFIGDNGIRIDDFIEENNIKKLNILHSDIQGYELEMLKGAENSFNDLLIDYVFISTHSQELHYSCLEWINQKGYYIISSCDLKETYCFDGIIIAQSPNIFPMLNIDIGKKEEHLLISDNDINDLFIKNEIGI